MATIDVAAEWPGRVAGIHVAVGDSVDAEQELITLELMKMQTPVTAPSAGRVEQVAVVVDDYVDEGGLLIRLEA